MGTNWEHTLKKTPAPLLLQNLKAKKLNCPKPSHWLHEISISTTVCHHFQPGLIPHHKLGALIQVSIH